MKGKFIFNIFIHLTQKKTLIKQIHGDAEKLKDNRGKGDFGPSGPSLETTA